MHLYIPLLALSLQSHMILIPQTLSTQNVVLQYNEFYLFLKQICTT